MKNIKYRAWDPINKEMIDPTEMTVCYSNEKGLYCEYSAGPLTASKVDGMEIGRIVECPILLCSGLDDSKGVDIYEGDHVYITGYGVYVASFPFLELYEAAMEDDIGEIIGCEYN